MLEKIITLLKFLFHNDKDKMYILLIESSHFIERILVCRPFFVLTLKSSSYRVRF